MPAATAPTRTRPWRGPCLAVVATAAILSGCVVGPNFLRPGQDDDAAYQARQIAEQEGEREAPQRIAVGKKIAGDWWHLFRSSTLNSVLDQAIMGNRTLASAKATLLQAQLLVDQVNGARYPKVGFEAGVQRSGTNFARSGFDQTGPTKNVFVVGPTVSFDLDLFGGLARQTERQAALADFQEHQVNTAYLTLTGNAVIQAVQIGSLRSQIAAVEDIIRQDEKNLAAVQKLFRVQEATRIDLQSAQSQLATDRTLLPPLRQQLAVARHALTVLIGEAPANWRPPDFDLVDFTLPEEVPLSLPSELVRQRPDILAAEAQLHAASAAIGVAEAQFYPNLSLSAALTQQALKPSTLFVPQATIWNVASNLAAPIFNGGALTAQRNAAEAGFQASLASYQQTVLQAFAQVADLMDALVHDGEAVEAQRRAVESTAASVKLTRDSFSAGEARLIQVLDAERLYGQARLGHIRAVAQRQVDTAQFFVAMGGAWWDWPRGELVPVRKRP